MENNSQQPVETPVEPVAPATTSQPAAAEQRNVAQATDSTTVLSSAPAANTTEDEAGWDDDDVDALMTAVPAAPAAATAPAPSAADVTPATATASPTAEAATVASDVPTPVVSSQASVADSQPTSVHADASVTEPSARAQGGVEAPSVPAQTASAPAQPSSQGNEDAGSTDTTRNDTDGVASQPAASPAGAPAASEIAASTTTAAPASLPEGSSATTAKLLRQYSSFRNAQQVMEGDDFDDDDAMDAVMTGATKAPGTDVASPAPSPSGSDATGTTERGQAVVLEALLASDRAVAPTERTDGQESSTQAQHEQHIRDGMGDDVIVVDDDYVDDDGPTRRSGKDRPGHRTTPSAARLSVGRTPSRVTMSAGAPAPRSPRASAAMVTGSDVPRFMMPTVSSRARLVATGRPLADDNSDPYFSRAATDAEVPELVTDNAILTRSISSASLTGAGVAPVRTKSFRVSTGGSFRAPANAPPSSPKTIQGGGGVHAASTDAPSPAGNDGYLASTEVGVVTTVKEEDSTVLTTERTTRTHPTTGTSAALTDPEVAAAATPPRFRRRPADGRPATEEAPRRGSRGGIAAARGNSAERRVSSAVAVHVSSRLYDPQTIAVRRASVQVDRDKLRLAASVFGGGGDWFVRALQAKEAAMEARTALLELKAARERERAAASTVARLAAEESYRDWLWEQARRNAEKVRRAEEATVRRAEFLEHLRVVRAQRAEEKRREREELQAAYSSSLEDYHIARKLREAERLALQASRTHLASMSAAQRRGSVQERAIFRRV